MSQQQRQYCDARGFVFDTKSHGNPGNVAPIASGYTYQITESGNFSTGAFSMEMSGLKPGTTYYNRACAHNSAGWGYGNEMSFTTKRKGIWKKITSYLEFDGVEVGYPSGVKIKLKRKG